MVNTMTSKLSPEIANHPVPHSHAPDMGRVYKAISIGTVGALFDVLCKKNYEFKQKGMSGALVPATFNGNRRIRKNAIEAGFIGLDIDGTETLAGAYVKIKASGFCCAVYTTASHCESVTEVKVSVLNQYMIDFKYTTIEESARWYLRNEKMYSESFITRVRVEQYIAKMKKTRQMHQKKIEEEVEVEMYRISHKPLDKFRVIIPLQVPWRLSDYVKRVIESVSYVKAHSEYSSWCRNVAAHIGLVVDEVCVDVERLFYLQTYTDEAARNRAQARIFQGALLEPRALPAAPVSTRVKWMPGGDVSVRLVRATLPPKLEVVDSEGVAGDLVPWFNQGGRYYLLANALDEVGFADDPRANEYKSDCEHWHLECPREFNHGPTNGGMYIIVPNSHNDHWGAYCCPHGWNMIHRLEYIKAWIENGTLTWSTLTDTQFFPPPPPTPEDDFDDDIGTVVDGSDRVISTQYPIIEKKDCSLGRVVINPEIDLDFE